MASNSTSERFLALPRLNVPDNQRNHQSNDEITPSPSNSAVSGGSPFLELPVTPGGASSSASSIFSFEGREDALRPDPGAEADFAVQDNKFAFSPGQMNKLLNPKSLSAYVALGGIHGIERGLRTDVDAGLSADETTLDGDVTFEQATHFYKKLREVDGTVQPRDALTRPAPTTAPDSSREGFSDRVRIFSRNVLPEKKTNSIWKLMWIAYQDKILILLTGAAIISLALGLYETFGVVHPVGAPPSVDWIEGLAICVAIIIVVLVGALNDWQKERAFARLNAKKEDREVKVIRSGKSFMISVYDILAGDVLHLEPGDLVPADGIFISGHNVKCDESSATGESDQLKKTGGEQVLRLLEQNHANNGDLDPFIISGSKVLEGVGTYMVTSVGVNSSYGKILMAMRQETEPTPLQLKLDALATTIAKLAFAASSFLFFVLFFRFCGMLTGHLAPLPGSEKASRFLDILIVAVTLIVVSVPEGLPLAVTLALAVATTRLVKLNNLVRILKSCETMGNATTVCSDKTGTLTTNKMTVVTGMFGDRSFDDKNQTGSEIRSTIFAKDQYDKNEKRLIVDSIAINSTAFEGEEGGEATFVGSKTETALLSFARNIFGMGSLSQERANANVVQLLPFDSGRKCMGAVYKLANGTHRFLVKGASEILLGHCTSVQGSSGINNLDASEKSRIEGVIEDYAKQSLRTIALTYKDFEQWPPEKIISESDPTQADLDLALNNMTLIGVVGIQDPVRPGVPEAVQKCAHAGVTVRMVTGDNVVTAKAIAIDCGIYTDGIVMEGPTFRKLSEKQFKETLPKLQVLARSSPEDKRILVTKLRELGEIVAVTGDGTNDGPALKAADIGFSMGIAGTEVAKEASAIILMDDNFSSIIQALMWGRAVNDAVRKFLQFQITVNIVAVVLTFCSAVASSEMKSVLTAVQLLWINLIMDSLAALALATDPPTEAILDRKPTPRSAPLISMTMWKMIIGQTIFQLIVTFIMYYAGPSILGYGVDSPEIRSMVFNTFVWMQIFNEFNSRRLDNKFNVFTGIHRNIFFIVITLIMIGCQVMIMFVGGRAFSIIRISGKDWAICMIIAALCLPWAIVVRIFPDVWFETVARIFGTPVLFVYRPTRRYANRVGGKIKGVFRKEKKEETPQVNPSPVQIRVENTEKMFDEEKHAY